MMTFCYHHRGGHTTILRQFLRYRRVFLYGGGNGRRLLSTTTSLTSHQASTSFFLSSQSTAHKLFNPLRACHTSRSDLNPATYADEPPHRQNPSDVHDMTEKEIVSEELFKIFVLDKENDDTYVARHLGEGTWITKNVYGGSLFAQSLVAAEKTVAEEYLPHAMHSMFLLNASTSIPVSYNIRRIRDGNSFCTRYVEAVQDGKIVYTTQISFQKKEKTAINHQDTMPKVPPPEECEAVWDLAQKYLDEEAAGKRQIHGHIKLDLKAKVNDKQSAILEFRLTDPELQLGLKPHNPQSVFYWVRVRAPAGDERWHHRALAAYITDATLVSVANRPHVSHGHLPSMLVSLDNNAWFHTDDYRTDEWLLYENSSPVANHGRAFSIGRLWTRDGRLVLSAAQESLSRSRKATTSTL